jgi:glutamine synthetase
MKDTLPKEACKAVNEAITKGKKIDLQTAHVVASGMKQWAIEKGATHVTHWFQPLTGLTAEKHDSFLDFSDGEPIESFSGKVLVQQEPDASSFPHGGIRQTFEARGYTGWDPSSNAFIMESGGFKTLCIPSIFVSYSGEALDKKVPHLRSIEVLDEAATEICKLFDKNVKSVYATLGAEQEYFLVDRAFYEARPDLVASGRTIFGAKPSKGQELSDHYFGSIKERAFEFMAELEREAHKLGIPLKTRHNEVAPHQFECAPVYEEANVAVDHNSLLMDVMDKVAYRLDLAVLFHEKPFDGVNGSGKHNNWSLSTDTGKNLLSPGSSPQENLQFLLFLTSITRAVQENPGLLRAAVASSGNDHRLGANEAPPAILSVFLGKELDEILNNIEAGKEVAAESARRMSFGISKIPDLAKDNTDRNRTSPFAFTGEKFEFRAVGSTQNIAFPNFILNSIVADSLVEAKKRIDEKMEAGTDKKAASLEVIREFIRESKQIRFEGDGYSNEWLAEAEKRGLPNVRTASRSYKALIADNSVALFENLGILSRRELESRYNIKQERYVMDISIEASLALDLTRTDILPAAVHYQKRLVDTVRGLKEVLGDDESYKYQIEMLKELTLLISETNIAVNDLEEQFFKGEKIENVTEQSEFFDDVVKVKIENLREKVDALEDRVDNDLWPLAKYSEMLFLM